MRVSSLELTCALFTTLAASQRLTKPPLQPNLDNLKQGLLDHLKPTHSTMDRWGAGWIPKACKDIAIRESKNPADFQVWNVHYDDVCLPSTHFCTPPQHLINMVDIFGRLPVHTHDYVRHVVSIPSTNGYAYNLNANVVMFGSTISNLPVFIHESAHSLDVQNAYKDKPLSSSAKWLSGYNQDTHVPDSYAQTNQVENVAQNTVIESYQRNVPGGFCGLNKDCRKIFHQYATVDTEQREAGNLTIPGGKCRKKLPNSEPVAVAGSTSRVMAADVQAMAALPVVPKPDVGIKAHLEILQDVPFDTKEACKGTDFT
ncbi:MAG: hypothetical protein L6R40_004623 [Gallowayella cf. fulva]|nr:MAG: hypothetical protein L6R40_004623 [Xanthomendoza cf. fulva]